MNRSEDTRSKLTTNQECVRHVTANTAWKGKPMLCQAARGRARQQVAAGEDGLQLWTADRGWSSRCGIS
jgi:hypothetical protein